MLPLPHVVFVHGYNNTHDQAQVSYARFRGWLEKLKAPARVLELHWPGDLIYTFPGLFAYPAQINRAIDCAYLFARWIEAQPSQASFTLVGHSLGCRLILETLKTLNSADRRRITGVCLMAAAVPATMIKSKTLGPLHTNAGTQWRILHSHGDLLVLGATFHLGQIFESFFSPAVGYSGEPGDLWRNAGLCAEMGDGLDGGKPFYNHGWYWPGGRSERMPTVRPGGSQPLPAISPPLENRGRSARAVAEMLGVVLDRELAKRSLPRDRLLPAGRHFDRRALGV
ncbi:alpha/beta hydrolase [Prosthecobacter sp.]